MGSLSFLFLIFSLSFSAFSLAYSSIFCTSWGSESFIHAASLLSRVWRMKFLEVAKTMSRVGTGWAKERTNSNGVAGMHAHRVEVFNRADDDAVVVLFLDIIYSLFIKFLVTQDTKRTVSLLLSPLT